MGTKFSKAGKGAKYGDNLVDESADTFDKTSTLPASFKKKDEEVTKAETLPRGNLDRSTSFSKRFRKSMTKLVGHKKVSENAKLSTEHNDVNGGLEELGEQEKSDVEVKVIPDVVEVPEVVEDDLKTTQMKARAQFFEDMYNSKEPVIIPKPPRSNIPSPIEQINEEDEEDDTVSVSVIGTPVVKLNENHQEVIIGIEQESPEQNNGTDNLDEEMVSRIEITTTEMIASGESKQYTIHEEANEQSEVELINDNSNETVKTKSLNQKINETITEKLETIEEEMLTSTNNAELTKHDAVETIEKVELIEEMESERTKSNCHASNTKEGVNLQNDTGKDEEKCVSIEEEKVCEMILETSHLETEVPVTENEHTILDSKELDQGNEDMNDMNDENYINETFDCNTEQALNLIHTQMDLDEKREADNINKNESFEILTSDIVNDAEESGAVSLESKCDSRIDDLSSEGGSEEGITTDEGIVASDDEDKFKEEDGKFLKLDILEQPTSGKAEVATID